MPLSVHVVTAEREVYAEEGVDAVIAPGIQGELTVLPQHAPLLTMIKSGVLRLIKGSDETDVAITGGFLEVKDDRVTILADAAERAEEIDTVRAEEARLRAERTLEGRGDTEELVAAAASLQRSLLRLRAVEKRRRRTPRGPSGPPGV